MSIPEIRGLVLSGGFSTRMGQDKGSLHWNGVPLLQHQVELIRSVTDSVFISCREVQAAAYSPYGELIIDQLPPHGPISGLLSSMRLYPQSSWLVLAVDLPFMTKSHLQQLLTHRQPDKMATVFIDPESGILQPLAALWEPLAFDLIQNAWDNNQFSLRRILDSNPVFIVEPVNGDALKNINQPEDIDLFS